MDKKCCGGIYASWGGRWRCTHIRQFAVFPVCFCENHSISLQKSKGFQGGIAIFRYVTLFQRKSNPRTAVNHKRARETSIGERSLREINNLCKMNFPDFTKKCSFEQKYNRDSSATDQKSIIFREIHQNTRFGRIFMHFRYVTLFQRKSNLRTAVNHKRARETSIGERFSRQMNNF